MTGKSSTSSFKCHDCVSFFSVSGLLQEPTGVRVSDVNMREIVFCWDPVNSFCSDSIDYKIISTHCGVCPATTNNSRAICSSPSIPGMCTFNIHSVVCGQTGAMSNSLILTLRRTLFTITLCIM